MIIYGINPVVEALRAGRVLTVRTTRRDDPRHKEIIRLSAATGVPVERVEATELDRVTRGAAHQGVAAELADLPDLSVAELVAGAVGPPLIVVLDGVEDPQNVGAILRAVDAAGADGVIRQTRHAAAIGGAAAKASAGAVAYARIAHVVNIARAIEELKSLGVWTVGLAGDAPRRYSDVDLSGPSALVLGAEGSGLRRLVRERCDLLASIPMRGHVDSLNVAAATAVVLFEAVRQRQQRPKASSQLEDPL